MDAYLVSSDVIDWRNPAVLARAQALAARAPGDVIETARRCFEHVRDEIRHSWDHRTGPLTCAASSVLEHGTGFCYAKSHLLAALLRANGIPAGLCYQRLSVSDSGPPFCLHGLVAVQLPGHGWYRVDARGNKPGVDAQFTPPVERLAFAARGSEERDWRDVLAEPLPAVVDALRAHATIHELAQHLPDATQLR